MTEEWTHSYLTHIGQASSTRACHSLQLACSLALLWLTALADQAAGLCLQIFFPDTILHAVHEREPYSQVKEVTTLAQVGARC